MPAESKDDFLREGIALIESGAVQQEKDSLVTFGMLAGQDQGCQRVRITPSDLPESPVEKIRRF